MGAKYKGIPEEIALSLKKDYGLNIFIESGTFRGYTTAWAAKNFSLVYTVEPYRDYIECAKRESCNGLDNIEFYCGESKDYLEEMLLKTGGEPALIWLDGHWGSDLHYSRPEIECPVLEELEIIKNSGVKHIIMIDDARLFKEEMRDLSKDQWLIFDKIQNIFDEIDYVIEIKDDVIIATPRKAE